MVPPPWRYKAAAPWRASSMMIAPHGAQRYASAHWAAGPQRKFIMFRELLPSLPTTCNVLPRMPLATLFDGAAFTHPRGSQNWRNNAVRTRFTMRELPQPPPPMSNIRRMRATGCICRGLLCFSHAICVSFAMSATGVRWSWSSVAASTRCFAKATGPAAARFVGTLCSSSTAS